MTLFTQDFQSRDKLVEFANGRASRGFIEMFDPRHLTDEQFLTVEDGTQAATQLTMDLDGGGVSGGVAVDVSGVANGDEEALADAIAAVINGIVGGLLIAAVVVAEGTGPGSKAKIELLNDGVGALGNIDILQGIEGGGSPAVKFKTTGMAGGADAITTANIIRIMAENGRWILFWL